MEEIQIIQPKDKGWISLHRKILDNPVCTRDTDHFAVWGYLILNATHKEIKAYFDGNYITLKPGQLITGRKSISVKWGLHESKVQRILKSFEIEHQIEQQTSNKNRLITITHWDLYQKSEQPDEQQMNNKRTTDEQQMNTNNNVNNKNNVNKNIRENKKSLKWLKANRDEAVENIKKLYPEKNAEACYDDFVERMGMKDYKYTDYTRAFQKWVREGWLDKGADGKFTGKGGVKAPKGKYDN